MTRVLCRWFGFALVALLAFTSVQVAAARGTAPAVGTMVLCIGQTVVTVSVDADGQPTRTGVHLCPDVALSLFVEEGAAGAADAPEAVWLGLGRDLGGVRGAGRAAPTAQARGPPSFL
ncbi:hypothetical protein ACN2XU_14615 [Primorskyibacter sp. 2E107]|uniref:hypothetical protein n=1 Tax=Primorskyibacter sp. 2E107 TaxID=3403458 RepID=UPI003AF6B53B